MDGRIISRSIDELWEAIKRLTGGRKSSREALKDNEVGYPYGTDKLETKCDSRPIVRNHEFTNDGQTFIGDPTYISYSQGNNLSFKVEEWINNPNKIHYSIMEELKSLSQKDYNDKTLTTLDSILYLLEKGISIQKYNFEPNTEIIIISNNRNNIIVSCDII